MADDITPDWGRRTFLKATGAAGAAAAVGATNVSAGRDPGPKENEIVVNLSGAASVQTAEVEIQEALPQDTNVVHRNDSLGYLAVDVPTTASAQARDRIKRQLASRGDVKSVEDNVTFEAHSVDDPQLGQQYAPDQVRAPSAWEKTLGSMDIELGIIDSGVNWTHEDLEDQFGSDKGEDFAGTGGDPPADGERHGTHVAGIASATTDNGVGVSGISNSQLFSLRALGGGRGSLTDIADAIDWCANRGVDVINMSLGGGGRTDLMKNAVSNAYSEGVLIFASAGNDGPTRDSVAFPAAYEECVAVSALQEGDGIANFSSRGPEVEITGPGADVLSTLTGDRYGELSGTSMSCPAVTGVAGLALAWAQEQGQSYSNDEMRALIKETARDVNLPETQQGAGCANADALLEEIGVGGGPGDVDADLEKSAANPDVGEEVSFDASDSSADEGISSFAWDAEGAADGSGATFSASWSEEGQYEVSVTVTGNEGETDSASGMVQVGEQAGPVADISASTTEPDIGEDVELDGTGSSSPNGEITEYVWSADGASVSSPTATLRGRETETSVDVTLEVTDEAGQTDATTKTFEFGDDAECGIESEGGSAEGSISWWNSSDEYGYTMLTADPCQLTVDLDGPSDADFDLYVTFDGRTPSPWDYDASSETSNADEQIVVDDPDGISQIGILVEGVAGWGSYVISVEELGA